MQIINKQENSLSSDKLKLLYISKTTIDKALNKLSLKIDSSTNIFVSIRECLHSELCETFAKQGLLIYHSVPNNSKINNHRIVSLESIETLYSNNDVKDDLSAEFALKYGFKLDSIDCLNYFCKPLAQIPSLKTLTIFENFFLGNFLFKLKSTSTPFSILLNFEYPFTALGYCFNTNSYNKTSLFGLLGVRIDSNYLAEYFSDDFKNCKCLNLNELKPFFPGYPPYFVCNKCGKIYICDCFNGFVDNKNIPDYFADKIKIKKNICSLCTLKEPTFEYHQASGSGFFKHYYPYILLFQKKYPNLSQDEIENIVRKYFGYPPKRKKKKMRLDAPNEH